MGWLNDSGRLVDSPGRIRFDSHRFSRIVTPPTRNSNRGARARRLEPGRKETLVSRSKPAARGTELDRLLRDLSGHDAERRHRAALRLGKLGDARALPTFEAALASADVALRVAAATALEVMGRPESRPALEAALGDTDWRVRAQAAYALSRLADRRSTLPLVDRLRHDASALVRNHCALALGRVGDPRAIPALERALEDVSDRVRREAILALERCGDPEAPSKVRRFLSDPAERVRIAAAVVLGVRRDPAAGAALLARWRVSSTWERPALIIALGRVGGDDAVETLVRAADDPMRSVRVCAIHALAETRTSSAGEVARRKLSDPSWAVRGAAALALGHVGTAEDGSRLLPLLGDPHPWPRRGAVYALGQLGVRRGSSAIRAALDDPDAEVRLAAIWALGRLGDRRARPRLTKLLRETRPNPRGEGTTLAESDGAVRLVSDANARLFGALVEAVGSLAALSRDREAEEALEEAERVLSEEELDQAARLPSPLGPGELVPSVRELFRSVRARYER